MAEYFSRVLIDLFFLIICLRVIYISISRGILRESFKVVGLLAGSIFAFHYYSSLADIISRKILFLNQKYFLFFSFLLILWGVGFIFTLSRLIVLLIFRKRVIYSKERLLLLFFGAFRVLLLASVTIFLLHLSPLDSKHFCHSITYSISKDISPKIYLMFFKVYNKLNPKAVLNKEVEEYYEAERSLSSNSK